MGINMQTLERDCIRCDITFTDDEDYCSECMKNMIKLDLKYDNQI